MEGGMLQAVTNFFRGLFTSHAGSDTEELLQCVTPHAMPKMNDLLMKEASDEEIKLGLDGIGSLKAPGDDGMSAIVYKTFGKL